MKILNLFFLLSVLSSFNAQEKIKIGSYCHGEGFAEFCLHILSETKDDKGQIIYQIAIYEDITYASYDTKNQVYVFNYSNGDFNGSFKNSANGLLVKLSTNIEDPSKFREFNFTGSLKFNEIEEEYTYTDNYLNTDEMDGEGAGPTDEALVTNPYHRQNMTFVDKSKVKNFDEVTFYSYENYNRFGVFFEESKLTDDQIKNVVIMISCITNEMQEVNYYATFDATQNKYKLFDKNDKFAYYMSLSASSKEMKWFDTQMKEIYQFHEMDGTKEGFPVGMHLFGDYITENNDPLKLEFSMGDDSNYESEPSTNLLFNKCPYGPSLIIDETENPDIFNILSKDRKQTFYTLTFIKNEVGQIELKDLKTGKVLKATYKFKE